ncbi:MAG: conserved membrane protein of unknown function [Promethearchaeota archaeon]|nr:MAG: conserved membrane protein of unknown function [Candidatus Lokiarchaeota archaeon]
MALELVGWLDGITGSIVVLTGCILGLFFIYKSQELGADLLLRLGLVMIFAGLAFLGVFLDFLVVIFTRSNMINPYGLVGLLSYVWVAPLIVLGINIGAELMIPEKRWYITSVFIILMIIFELLIFIDPLGSFNFVYPSSPGDGLIDYNANLTSLAGIMMIILLISIVFFVGIGFLIKAIQSTGDLRKKFLLLAVGVFIYTIFGLLESLMEPGFLLIPIRVGYISGPIFMYFGLKS